ncbi:arginine deiminase family protein [Pontibacillus litoralis]|uniref:Arginine deiminase n=1 Tax=Pontibacillus litoralis JSM 072002 TaxID=1385512 RepID=A0A0A5G450_9BACI|nr:arginine deiminase family protein [Pontibacillus litoralis]KGX86829.1 arginine deiminase [Pontibacillus litoralis JSM 072002]
MYNLRPHCQSEIFSLRSVIVSPPSVIDIPNLKAAKEVQWNEPVNHSIAQEQHNNLCHALSEENVHILRYTDYLCEPDARLSKQLINRMFVRDLACVMKDTILPGHAGTSMRKPEYDHMQSLLRVWFCDEFKEIDVQISQGLEFGDLLILNRDAILINVGARTSVHSVKAILKQLFAIGFSEIAIIDLPRTSETLHLDMNCNIAHEDVIVAKSFLRFFPIQVYTNEKDYNYYMMEDYVRRHQFEVYWLEVYNTIPDINFLNINPETILLSTKANRRIFNDHPKLRNKNIIPVEVDELEKGGGGIRCMTLPLERRN